MQSTKNKTTMIYNIIYMIINKNKIGKESIKGDRNVTNQE